MGKFIDLTGMVFGRLTVIKRVYPENKDKKRTYWECLCVCGNKKDVVSTALKEGLTQSCGCLNKENARKNGLKKLKEIYPYTTLFNRTRRDATSRNLEFNLTIDEFKSLISQDCYLCGCNPSTVWKKQAKHHLDAKDLIYNGIDRLDNNIGYIFNNCRPCCWRCNVMKMNQTLHSFIERITTIFNRNKNKLIC